MNFAGVQYPPVTQGKRKKVLFSNHDIEVTAQFGMCKAIRTDNTTGCRVRKITLTQRDGNGRTSRLTWYATRGLRKAAVTRMCIGHQTACEDLAGKFATGGDESLRFLNDSVVIIKWWEERVVFRVHLLKIDLLLVLDLLGGEVKIKQFGLTHRTGVHGACVAELSNHTR